MIRGAVEQVQGNRVSGWVYSPTVDLRGSTVLAFVDDLCVGAGKVDIFRQDLVDAGLGDGRFGYSFPVALARPSDGIRLVVKLEGSDALLKQAASRIQGLSVQAPKPPVGALALSLHSLQWMQRRGWLRQSDYDFLRYFAQLGVYGRPLSAPAEKADRGETRIPDPAETAEELMSLINLCSVDPPRVKVPAVGDIPAVLAKYPTATTIVALWSKERASLDVVEASHLHPSIPEGDQPAKPAVEYPLGPDRLLFLDTRAVFGRTAMAPPGGIDVFIFTEE
jgi:hypothetical protein